MQLKIIRVIYGKPTKACKMVEKQKTTAQQRKQPIEKATYRMEEHICKSCIC